MMEDAYLSTFLQPGGDPHVLCFVDFDNPAQATIALEALQGESTHIFRYRLCSCVDFLILSFGDLQFCMYMLVKFYYARLHPSTFVVKNVLKIVSTYSFCICLTSCDSITKFLN